MIKLQRLTPEVYNNESRDFQFIARLFDVVLNSVKTNSELIYGVPLSDNSDDQLLDLMAMTLGFKQKHNYNVKQLRAVCSSFSHIMRNKGSLEGIQTACDAILQAEGLSESAKIFMTSSAINIVVPIELTDLNLLKDILSYILPAGMSCSITREALESKNAETVVCADINVITKDTHDIRTKSVIKNDYTVRDQSASNTDAYTDPGFIMNTSVIDTYLIENTNESEDNNE